ncbi:MAG: glycosyltransferase family 2 protein [Bacteroidota bacterium]
MNTSTTEKLNEYSISVVIPNYNGRHLLEANLPAVYAALKFTGVNYEVIVIDDASSDTSVAFIQQQYPEIKLLINDINKGFSPTINKGIFSAQHKLVLALNSDVWLTEDYFVKQFKYFEASDTFGVMGKITDFDSPKIQDGAKFPKISYKGIKTTFNYIPDQVNQNIWLPGFFLSGANALMDRTKLIQLGGYNELYAPFYYEDADLGIRAWRVGWKCYFEPESICKHAISSTIGKLKSEKVKIIIERNRIAFNHLHLMGPDLFLFKCWLQLRCFSRLLSGNSIIYKAIKLFRKNREALEQSKQALKTLQEKNKNFSVYQTEKYILEQIKSIPYRIF